MSRWLPVLSVAALLAGAAVLSATTVIPPTFDELVAKADTIFVGRAVGSSSEFEVRAAARTIVTHVTFAVERVIKGQVGLQTELTFLGGTVGDLALDVADMPQFRVGDRDVLFVSGAVRAISPLVGFSHGRFRVVRNVATGVDEVQTHDGRSLASVAEIGRPRTPTLRSVQAMSLTDFEALVRQRAAALGGR